MTRSGRAERRRGRWLPVCLCLVLACMLWGCAPPKFIPSGEVRLQLEADSSSADQTYRGFLFLSTDRVLTARLDWPQAPAGMVLEWILTGPDGTVKWRERRLFLAPEDEVQLSLAVNANVVPTGEWRLRVGPIGRMGSVAETHLLVVKDKNEWRAASSDYPEVRFTALGELCAAGNYAFLIGQFSFDLPEYEKGAILSCLIEKPAESSLPLSEKLRQSPLDERLLVLAYRIKLTAARGLVNRQIDAADGMAILRRLLTRWDVGVAKVLLEAEDIGLRRQGVELLNDVGTVEAVLELGRRIDDPAPAVRMAVVETLARLALAPGRRYLVERLPREDDASIHAQIAELLSQWHGE